MAITTRMSAAILISVLLSTAAASPCISTVRDTYKLADIPLSSLNPWLSHDADYSALVSAGCDSGRDDGKVCFDKPAIGSGLAQLDSHHFLGLTDRGPNQDCEDLANLDATVYSDAVGKSGKGFPVPAFAPTIVRFAAGGGYSGMHPKLYVPLLGVDGKPISGLPNTASDDTPYGKDCSGYPLAFDPSGLDPEDLAPIPGTKFVAIVDEYSPSVVLANYETGHILSRSVPSSVAPALAGASYPVIGDIPNVFASRRKNRGFEAVVVDENATYVIAILQSPMLGSDDSVTENNNIIRAAYFDLTVDAATGVPSIAYKMQFVLEASPVSSYKSSNKPKDLKYSGAQYASPGKFIALERAKGQVKLFLVDWTAATNVDTTGFASNLGLEMASHKGTTLASLGVVPASKTLIWDSAPGPAGAVNFDGSSKQEGFVVDMNDPTSVWMIDDNDFGLEGTSNVEFRRISLGRSVDGATICDAPAHPPSPNINVTPSRTISLQNSLTYRVSDQPGAGAAENLDVDEEAAVAYVANGATGAIDKYDIEIPCNGETTSPPIPIGSFNATEGFAPTSTAVCKKTSLVAAAFAAPEDDVAGRIYILNPDLTVNLVIPDTGSCFLPDHIKWSADCAYLVTACEGEGKSIPGGVLVSDFTTGSFRGSKFAGFAKFDSKAAEVRSAGVRLVESSLASTDFEPEYVTIVGTTAYVTLQEANALAVVDLAEATIGEVKPLGFIDRSLPGFGLDASDRDGGINIANYAFLFGMPQPDSIAHYVAGDGAAYLVYANEGDAKDDFEARGADLVDADELGRSASAELTALLEDKAALGRLKVTTIDGYNAETNTQEAVYNYGARSFSIMALNGTVVFDSGEWLERIMEAMFAPIFNANGFDDGDLGASQADLVEKRSDDKGGEPESLSLMTTDGGRTYAFVGLERASIVCVFDVTDAGAPAFVDAVQNHPVDEPVGDAFRGGRQGDLDPEGLLASYALARLFVSGSVSNTVSSYDIVGV